MSDATRSRRVRQQWWWWAAMGVVALGLVVASSGRTPTEGVSDERLFSLASRLKCQQCVGESVAGSQSPSAVQFRQEIAQQMAAGRTDDEILNYFADRYEGVLLTPPSTGVGALVWVVPVVAVAGAGLLLVSTFRRWRAEVPARSATPDDVSVVEAALRRRSETDDPDDGTTADGASTDGTAADEAPADAPGR